MLIASGIGSGKWVVGHLVYRSASLINLWLRCTNALFQNAEQLRCLDIVSV